MHDAVLHLLRDITASDSTINLQDMMDQLRVRMLDKTCIQGYAYGSITQLTKLVRSRKFVSKVARMRMQAVAPGDIDSIQYCCSLVQDKLTSIAAEVANRGE